MKQKQTLYTFEEKQIFSKSMLWDIQREYFRTNGIELWGSGEIPYYVTSNVIMGKAYADVAIGFLKDLGKGAKTTGIVYFLELGAGHGRFSYYFLRHFTELYKQSTVPLPPFRYIMSDISDKNLAFWDSSEKLQPFVKEGLLDYCMFDIEKTTELHLIHSGECISKGSLTQPLIVIGNYVLDSIPQDLFYVNEHELHTCLSTLRSERKESDHDIFRQPALLHLEYDYLELDEMPYEESYLCDLLDYYKSTPLNTHFLFPAIGIQCIHCLRELSVNGLLLLTADKGSHYLDECDAPQLVTHGGCFSLNVNYHAFKLYCEERKGKTLFPDYDYQSINIGCFLMLEDAQEYYETTLAYEQSVNNCGPDILYQLSEMLTSRYESIRVSDLVRVINISQYDPYTFLSLLPYLYSLFPQITKVDYQNLCHAIPRIWDMNYPLPEQKDLAYELGELLFFMERYPEAAQYFQRSEKVTEEHVESSLLSCYYKMKDYQKARDLFYNRMEGMQHV